MQASCTTSKPQLQSPHSLSHLLSSSSFAPAPALSRTTRLPTKNANYSAQLHSISRTRSNRTKMSRKPPPKPNEVREDGEGASQIAQFYEGKCVLVTGVSGFLGKLILEKLLRTCGGIRKIFVLIRPKRDKSAEQRMSELFHSPLFEPLKKLHDGPEHFDQLKSKVVLVEGDLTKPLLGLNIERLLQMADEVSVVLHSAAVVNFAGKLRNSLESNLVGTRNMLELAARMANLRAFVYISSSYANSTRHSIQEHIYPTNMDPKRLIELVEALDEEALEPLGAELVGAHPNSYTYSKQQAELLCGQYAVGPQQVPVLICRPSIIISAHSEPATAFVDNRNAGNGLFDGVARGVMRVCWAKPDAIMDLVPADFVSNCSVALAWFADLYYRARARIEPRPEGQRHLSDERTRIQDAQLERKMVHFYKSNQAKLDRVARQYGANFDANLMQVPVVHVTSGAENPITYDRMFRHIARHSLELPSSQLFRQPRCSIYAHRYVWLVAAFWYHFLVGKLLDWFYAAPRQLTGRRSSTWAREFARIDRFNQLLAYFISRSFHFEPFNRGQLIGTFMAEPDRRLFPCDMRAIKWEPFARDITLGIRRHLNGEPDDTLPAARAKLRRTLWRNWLLRTALLALAGGALVLWLRWW